MKKLFMTSRNQKGFTLIEFVVVAALGALMLVGISLMITQSRESAAMTAESDRVRAIMAGLSEYKMYKGSFPLQATSSTTWPTGLNSYVPTEYRAGGTYPYAYKCDTTSKSITLASPAQESNDVATNLKNKMVDQGLCDSTSTTTTNVINCVIKPFAANAGCV